jgi:hypothetical protein
MELVHTDVSDDGSDPGVSSQMQTARTPKVHRTLCHGRKEREVRCRMPLQGSAVQMERFEVAPCGLLEALAHVAGRPHCFLVQELQYCQEEFLGQLHQRACPVRFASDCEWNKDGGSCEPA